MKIQLIVTTNTGRVKTLTTEGSALTYQYVETVLTHTLAEIFREEATGLLHKGETEGRP